MSRICSFIILSLLLCTSVIFAGNDIKVIFRFDDFTLENNTFQDSILKAFDDASIPVSLAVIPFDQSPVPKPYQSMTKERLDYLEKLIGKNIVEVTQHGFNHKKSKISEFKGVTEEKQYSLIYTGKHYLDSALDINMTTFIPPWNSYDSITLDVLTKLNFKGISADIYGICSSGKISYIPCTYQYIYNLKNIISKNKLNNVILTVMLHPYNFYGHEMIHDPKFGNESKYQLPYKASFKELSDLLHWLNLNEIKCYTYSQLINSGEDLSSERYRINSKPFDGIISSRFEYLYVPVYYKWFKVADKIFWVAYYLFIILLLYIGKTFLKIKIKHRLIVILFILSSLLLLAFLIYGRFTHKFLLLINGLGAFWIFLSYIIFKDRNRNRELQERISVS